jgi:hypothetical protein
MKKIALLTLILVASASAMGCIVCKDVFQPGPTYTPTVAGPTPTATPTDISPLPPQYLTIETNSPPNQNMPNQTFVSHPRYYRTADWTLPVPQQGLTQAHHGVIHELDFWNPTDQYKTISVYNLKSAFYETMDSPSMFIQSYEIFYGDQDGFFSQFVLSPHEHRTVLMYAYITDDAVYEKFKGHIMEPVSVIAVPDYTQ